jgi:hypothetical protein
MAGARAWQGGRQAAAFRLKLAPGGGIRGHARRPVKPAEPWFSNLIPPIRLVRRQTVAEAARLAGKSPRAAPPGVHGCRGGRLADSAASMCWHGGFAPERTS